MSSAELNQLAVQKGLNSDTGPIYPGLLPKLQFAFMSTLARGSVEGARIDLNRYFGFRADGKMFPARGDQPLQLIRRNDGRSASAKVDCVSFEKTTCVTGDPIPPVLNLSYDGIGVGLR